MKIDALAITSTNFKETVRFYKLLGFQFPDFDAEEKHIEPIRKENEVRLMIDDAGLIESITGVKPIPPTHSSFAMLCNSPSGVDAAIKLIRENGYTIVKDPWDAFWGQRYAIIKDPDGYMVDLFAAL